MRKLEVLKSLLVQDRLIKFNLDLLEGLLREIRADIEEIKILVESCLEEEERESLLKTLADFEANFKNLIVQALDYIYDLYELFNFDITFLSNIPEELGREIERLDAVNSINKNLETLAKMLEDILNLADWDERTKVILTPLRIYREVLEHGMAFNQKLAGGAYVF
jgi:signal transduction histidine kinase